MAEDYLGGFQAVAAPDFGPRRVSEPVGAPAVNAGLVARTMDFIKRSQPVTDHLNREKLILRLKVWRSESAKLLGHMRAIGTAADQIAAVREGLDEAGREIERLIAELPDQYGRPQ